MTLFVHAQCGYPSIKTFKENSGDLLQSEWNGYTYIRAIKGEEMKNHAFISDITGTRWKIDKSGRGKAIEIFGRWAAQRLNGIGKSAATLVPIPSSTQTTFSASCTAYELAASIAKFGMFPLAHTFAFKKIHQADHKKRGSETEGKPTRLSQDEIYDNLQSNQKVFNGEHILVDDVYTMGRHVGACAKYLRERGATVSIAICAARTIWERQVDNFDIAVEDIEANPFDF